MGGKQAQGTSTLRGVMQLHKDFMFLEVRKRFLLPMRIAWGKCCFENLTCSFCPELKHQYVNTLKVKYPVVILLSHG